MENKFYRTYDFISLFGDIKPRLTYQMLSNAYKDIQLTQSKKCLKTGLKSTTLASFFISGQGGDTCSYITPSASRAFILLYKNNKLVRQSNDQQPKVPIEASRYANSDKVSEKNPEPALNVESKIASEIQRKTDADTSPATYDLSFKQINQHFMNEFGAFTGEKKLSLEGLTYTKKVEKQPQGNLKILINWKDRFGVIHDLTKYTRRHISSS